jgi:omega-6 fatty acid desaturase (delta-12 desaturase)
MNINEIKALLGNWQERVRPYQKPSKRKATIQLANTFGGYLLTWWLMYKSLEVSYWLTLALAVLNAFFLVRIFIIQHDCGHHSFLKSRKLNAFIGRVCSCFSWIPYTYWARSHAFHHAHNGQLWEHRDIGDIPLLTVREYHGRTALQRFRYRLYRSVPVMFFIGPIYYVFIHNRFPFISFKGWEKTRRSIHLSNVYIMGTSLLIALLIGWKSFLLVQIPIWVFFATIAVWFFYVQHQHDPNYKAWRDNWEYLLAALRGTTFYKLPRWMHWMTGNIGYHHIHHLNSLIPNYNLAKCNRENPQIEALTVQITFWESFKCVFNKLWDEDSGRMISFREFKRLERAGVLG